MPAGQTQRLIAFHFILSFLPISFFSFSCVCVGQRSMLDVIINCFLLYIWRQGLSPNPELTDGPDCQAGKCLRPSVHLSLLPTELALETGATVPNYCAGCTCAACTLPSMPPLQLPPFLIHYCICIRWDLQVYASGKQQHLLTITITQ